MRTKEGYFPAPPSDTLNDLRGEMVLTLLEAGVDVDAIAPQVNEKFFSAFVRANKSKAACCQAGC